MTGPRQNEYEFSTDVSDEVATDADQVEKYLLTHIEEDHRLQSGVPDEQKADDLDFIQMTGLIHPDAVKSNGVDPQRLSQTGWDESQFVPPLDFSEEGVADVDAAMTPTMFEDPESFEEAPPDSSPMAGLKQIIADLTREKTAAYEWESEDTLPHESRTNEPHRREESSEKAQQEGEQACPSDLKSASGGGATDLTPGITLATDDPNAVTETALGLPRDPEYNVMLERPTPADEVYEEGGVNAETPGGLDIYFEDDIVTVTAALPKAQIPSSETHRFEPQGSDSASDGITKAPSLSEAERVIRESEAQLTGPRRDLDTWPVEDDPSDPPQRTEALQEEADQEAGQEENDASVYRRAADPRRARRRKRRSRGYRLLARWAIRAALLLAVVTLVYGAYSWYEPRYATPEKMYYTAVKQKNVGNYLAASDNFARFAALHPDHELAPEAYFQQAFTLQLAEDVPQEVRRRNFLQSIELLGRFTEQYPEHERAIRARILLGILYFKLGDCKEALSILGNPELRQEDPDSTLSVLRTLARANGELGNVEASQTYYRQAAVFPGNYRPDQDYAELGDVYLRAGNTSQDGAKRIEYSTLALQEWNRAVRSPMIGPERRNAFKEKLDRLRESLIAEGHQFDKTDKEQNSSPIEWQFDVSAPVETAPQTEGIE